MGGNNTVSFFSANFSTCHSQYQNLMLIIQSIMQAVGVVRSSLHAPAACWVWHFWCHCHFFFQGTSYDSYYVSNTTSTALFMCASCTERLFTPVPPTDRLHEWRCEKAASKWHVVVSRKIARSCLFLWKSAEDDFSCCRPENFELKLHLMDVALKHKLIPFSFLLLVNWLVWLF